jgi:hypothetical protein
LDAVFSMAQERRANSLTLLALADTRPDDAASSLTVTRRLS